MAVTSLIEAEVHAPSVVEIPEGADTIEISVRTDLHNVSDHDYVLHTTSGDTHFWHVLDENHREVIRDRSYKRNKPKPKADDVHPVRTQTISAGLSTHDSEILTLDAKKLKDGRVYTVRCEIWGQVTETTFVAVRPPKGDKEQKKTTRKSGTKKTASKKTGTKKAAPKKTATKKTGAKKTTAKKK